MQSFLELFYNMKKHTFTTLAIISGLMSFSSCLSQQKDATYGLIIFLSALACRSANKRRNLEVVSTKTRIFFEFLIMSFVLALTLLPNNLKYLIATDPVPNFLIPFLSVVFYIIDFVKAYFAVKNGIAVAR